MNDRITALASVGKTLEGIYDLDALIENLSKSRLVLLGEASHGTHEYYTWRTAISKRLIAEHGFNFIAVEGDWPDFYNVNRFVKHHTEAGADAVRVLKKFNRWPTWMWANWEIETLVNWLYEYNAKLSNFEKAGIYGLDVYSLWESMEAMINYLKDHDPKLLPEAKRALGCFEPFGDEMGMTYARSLHRLIPKTCENEVVSLLRSIRQRMANFNADMEASLNMEQNAHIAKNAETDIVHEGSINLGQLVREELGMFNPKIVGFGSFSGTVVAGSEWGAPMRNMHVPKAREGSWEYLLHSTGKGDQIVFMEELKESSMFMDPIPHRAIGVVYHPKYEHIGNYVPSIMPERYDVFIHLDVTTSVHPMTMFVDRSQLPETYPWAF